MEAHQIPVPVSTIAVFSISSNQCKELHRTRGEKATSLLVLEIEILIHCANVGTRSYEKRINRTAIE